MWGEIAGALLGPVTEGMASAAQYQASKHERNISWKRMGQWELISPSLRVAGLKAAGLNPILAATGGFKGGSPHVPEGSPGGMPSFDFDMGRIYNAARQRQAMQDELATIKANRQTAQSEAAAAAYLPEKAYHAAGAEGERWNQLRESVALLRQQQDATAAQAEATRAAADRTRVDTRIMETEIPAAKALESLYEEYPWLRKVGAVLKDTRR